MKIIPDQKILYSLFNYDSVRGVLLRKDGREAGCDSGRGYRQVRIMGTIYFVHRVVFKMVYGEIPVGKQVDHIDHNGLNNRINNLRLVAYRDNSKNKSMQINNTSGHTGVYFNTNRRWVAQIKKDGRVEYLGSFVKKEEAVEARKKAEKVHSFHANHGKTVVE